MTIYTRGGDKGKTQVYAAETLRLDKDDIILETYGAVDELNSHLGLLASQCSEAYRPALQQIQRNLFQVGFAISADTHLSDEDVTALENAIDTLAAALPPLTCFTLPGGSQAAAQAHICRVVCRRAERRLVSLSQQHPVPSAVLAYTNRLSDYLFTLARTLNAEAGISDPKI